MGPETKQCRERIIKIAKADYLDAFLKASPGEKFTKNNICVTSNFFENEFTLQIYYISEDKIINEESFIFSDF